MTPEYTQELSKLEQVERLRKVLLALRHHGKDRDRELLLMGLKKGYGEDAKYFGDLSLTKRLAIFYNVFPENEQRFAYQKDLGYNDTGNAQRLIARHGDNILHVSPKGFGWYVWDGFRWKEDDGDKAVFRYAKDTARSIADLKNMPEKPVNPTEEQKEEYEREVNRIKSWMNSSLNEGRLHSMMKLAATEQEVSTHFNDMNQHPYLFNVKNGTIDLRTGELLLPQRGHRLTQMSSTEYNPEAHCPNWIQFLKTIFHDDEGMIRYIQWLFGYFLIGHNNNQRLYMLVGQGKNGKSTLLEVARGLLGTEYSLLTDFSVLSQSSDEKSARNNIASFFQKRLIAISESNRDQVLAEGCVKRMTGESSMMAEKKYGQPFEIPTTFKMVMMSQHLPRIIGQDTGIWRRFVVIPFTYEIPEDDRDPKFYQNVLKPELLGILAWAIQGAQMYQDLREVDILPEVCKVALRAYQEDTDFFGQFLSECLAVEQGEFLPQDDLMIVAKKWGQMNNCQSLVNSGVHNWKTMFESNAATKHMVKRGRKRVGGSDGDNRKYGFEHVTLSERGRQLLLGKDLSALKFLDSLSDDFRKNYKQN